MTWAVSGSILQGNPCGNAFLYPEMFVRSVWGAQAHLFRPVLSTPIFLLDPLLQRHPVIYQGSQPARCQGSQPVIFQRSSQVRCYGWQPILSRAYHGKLATHPTVRRSSTSPAGPLLPPFSYPLICSLKPFPRWLQQEMRSNHAGETGAVTIYSGARSGE